MTGILHVDLYACEIISRLIFLSMRNISNKICRENKKTHFRFKHFCFFENRVGYQIRWVNMVQPVKTDNNIMVAHAHFMLDK
jgi:hypothetical protein